MSLKNRSRRWFAGVLFATVLAPAASAEDETAGPDRPTFRAALLSAEDVTTERLKRIAGDGFNSVVVLIEGTSQKEHTAQRRAAELVSESSLDLRYWIEVARCPDLADAHPEWMASLQTHDEWRRFFPETPQLAADEVAKTYPWVPILSREAFAAQLDRVKKLLANKPKPDGLFLNDLQGAPSACGCGNPLCRWTSDYGERRTTTPLGDDAATLFVNAVKKIVPGCNVIPVWTTECEQHDGAEDGLCAGVGCFDGICWKAYVRQLRPLEQSCEKLAVFVPYRAFSRDLPIYGREAGWIRHAIETFADMPPRHGGRPIEPSRLITVLQGWNVDNQQVAQQIQVAIDTKVSGYIVAYEKLEQSWQPKVIRWR